MKENEIRDDNKLKKYQNLVDKDFKKFFKSKKNFKKINSKLWGCKNTKVIFIKKNFLYHECLDTGTIFANPRPTQNTLNKFYSSAKSSNYWYNKFYLPKLKFRINKTIKPKASFLINNFSQYQKKKILDVGSGAGFFLKEIKKKWPKANLYALEPSSIMAKKCKEHNISVYESTIENFKTNKKFDVITSFELLEHVFDPYIFLKKIYDILNKNGILYFTTLSGKGFDIQLLKENSNSIYPPYHINFFNINSLKIILKKIGFKKILIDTPGELDFNIVEKNHDLIPDNINRLIFKKLLKKMTNSEKINFQKLLKKQLLSSHMRIVAKK